MQWLRGQGMEVKLLTEDTYSVVSRKCRAGLCVWLPVVPVLKVAVAVD